MRSASGAEGAGGSLPCTLRCAALSGHGAGEERSGGGVENPGKRAVGGGDELRGDGLGIARTFDDLLHRGGFAFPGNEEDGLGGIVENGGGESDPPGVDLIDMGSHHEALLLMQGWAVGKERCGGSVGPEAEENAVETRQSILAGEELSQGSLVEICGFDGGAVAGGDAVNVCGRNGNARKQHLAGQGIVAVGMAGRDVALVSPEEMDCAPGNESGKGLGDEGLEEEARRTTAGKCGVDRLALGSDFAGEGGELS